MSKILSLCVCLALVALPAFAAPPLASGHAPASDLAPADGWIQVQEGVLQMQDETGRLHHITWGKSGQRWLIADLEAQLGRMLVDAAKIDDGSLDAAIARHEKLIADERALLASGADLGTVDEAWALTKAEPAGLPCEVSFSYDAYVGISGLAIAESQYEAVGSSCPSGTVYAYAYGRTTRCGTTTTQSQTDPSDTGLNVTGTASTSVQNVGYDPNDPTRDCYGYAYASVKLGGTTYSTSDSPGGCNGRFYDPCNQVQ